MSAPPRPPRPFLPLVARLVLGVAFVYLGAVKALDPVGFLKLVRQFDALPHPLALNATAALLPWFEIFCGLLLLLGIRPRGTALVTTLLLLAFTALIALRALALYRSGTLPFCGIRFDCGCGTGEVLICAKLAENTTLIGLSLLVLFSSSPPNASSSARCWPGNRI